MPTKEIKSVVIAGGGTAGWMAAAAIAKVMGPRLSITLVESDEIGIIGVGEATIPSIALFNDLLRLDENQFLRQTQGTYKLGIEFVDWYEPGHTYMHAFGGIGKDLAYIPFHHYWLEGVLKGRADSLWNYSLNWVAARQNRFARLEGIADTPLPGLTYAFHFDASLYAAYLSRLAQQMGVRRVEGLIAEVLQDQQSGDVRTLRLRDGREISAEFFIDCTGFRGLLIEQTLKAGYEDWSRWLPCDRALAVPTARDGALTPYTRSTALEAGWQWRIPLQHRTGNGHVYSSAYISDDRAAEQLLANLDSRPLADPRAIRFVTGRRRELWRNNVVCLGLASGFVEPLESTAIHLIQANIQRLILLFPHHGDCAHRRAQFNQAAEAEYEFVRDFIILHYHLNNRVGERFWDDCRHMSVPDSLTHKIEVFRETGGIFPTIQDLFHLTSWLQVMWGQGVRPRAAHPFVQAVAPLDRAEYLKNIRELLAHAAGTLPRHEEFIARHCAAPDAAVSAR
ncbi:MAG: tryptophan halogenase family protein [Gammaproteobacteria bacterium]